MITAAGVVVGYALLILQDQSGGLDLHVSNVIDVHCFCMTIDMVLILFYWQTHGYP